MRLGRRPLLLSPRLSVLRDNNSPTISQMQLNIYARITPWYLAPSPINCEPSTRRLQGSINGLTESYRIRVIDRTPALGQKKNDWKQYSSEQMHIREQTQNNPKKLYRQFNETFT